MPREAGEASFVAASSGKQHRRGCNAAPTVVRPPVMALFQVVASVIVLSAIFAFANYKLLRLPTTIGVMTLSLAVSLILIGLGKAGITGMGRWATVMLERVDFDDTVLHGLLAFLLFAGALHIDLSELGSQKFTILLLATVGVLVSTLIIGSAMFYVLQWIGLAIPYLHCLLFGALISPTDPIAVLGILKRANVPKSLEIKIAGESLFNDGIGVVVFLGLLEVVSRKAGGGGDSSHDTAGFILKLFLEEAVGGIALGLVVGFVAYRMLRSIDHYQTEVLITLGVATGTYALADTLHSMHVLNLSGPLAVVTAGLLVGNHGRSFAMSQQTVDNLDTFWELIDEVLNAALFALIGLELLVIPLQANLLLAGAIAIVVSLAARFLSVAATIRLMQFRRSFTPGAIRILTWCGLRGGISVALVLSIPPLPNTNPNHGRETLLTMTYCVVIFSILVQGLTVGPLVRRAIRTPTPIAPVAS